MNPHLLMIEDDARLAAMVGEYLAQSGFTVSHAPDATAGLARLQGAEAPPQLVILDLMLPDMDGLEVCRRVRALPGNLAQTPILMLTAKGDPMDRIIGLEMGADDYLPKPFEPRASCWRASAPSCAGAVTTAPRPASNCASARWPSTATRAPSPSTGGRANSPPTSSTCWLHWPSAPAAC